MYRNWLILALLVLGSSLCMGGNNAPSGTTGKYSFNIAGDYEGSGTAQIGATSGTFSGTVKYRGNSGQFTATVACDGNHFTGTGAVMGQTLTIAGRLDGTGVSTAGNNGNGNGGNGNGNGNGNGKNNGKKTLAASRIVGTFRVSDTQHGKLVGPMTASDNGSGSSN